MNDKTILKLKSNWDKIKIIATITFIILAGTVYSVSTMIKGGKADDRIELVVTDSVISTSDGAGSHFDSSDDSILQNEEQKLNTQRVIRYVLDMSLRLLHPIMPHITEKI